MSSGARPPLRLAILISGRGSNMAAIARSCIEGQINARVEVVLSDRAAAKGLETARELGIDARAIEANPSPQKPIPDSIKTSDTRGDGFTALEHRLNEVLDAKAPDLIVLAGFMRILSAAFVERYAGRMLNIHPSLLPNYKGLHTHRRVLEAKDVVHGASVHYVTAELDGGPVVLQSKVAVRPGDTEDELAARVMSTEHVIYSRVIGWLASGRLAWREGVLWLDGEPLSSSVVEDFRAAPEKSAQQK